MSRRQGTVAMLVDHPIPWKRIEQSLEAMQRDETPAWISPRQPVSVQVRVGATHGRAVTELEGDLKRVLIERLAIADIKVAERQPAVIAMEYNEQVDRPQPFARRNLANLGQSPGRNTATVKLQIFVGNDPSPVWSRLLLLSANQSGAGLGESSLVEQLTVRLARTVFPYFIPKQNELLALPAVIRP